MNNPRIKNNCPKRERCKHGADCVNHDTFRGEYLCFESTAINVYEYDLERHKAEYVRKTKPKKARRKQ